MSAVLVTPPQSTGTEVRRARRRLEDVSAILPGVPPIPVDAVQYGWFKDTETGWVDYVWEEPWRSATATEVTTDG